ncbi:MAG: DeoR family transcriptional regulator, partial [Erysipelothrix sp.]|nr:DeoR family transcriptional regulator [Erysipelothrix sp.]
FSWGFKVSEVTIRRDINELAEEK